MTFHLGATSEANLQGVKPPIVRCVRRAIMLTTQDFGVFEGVRSHARQLVLFQRKATRTMNSLHLVGGAVDLLPFVDGRLQWQTPLSFPIAQAMLEASQETGIHLRWGGVWDRLLHELDPVRLDREMRAYWARFEALHPDRDPLVDPWHFEEAA